MREDMTPLAEFQQQLAQFLLASTASPATHSSLAPWLAAASTDAPTALGLAVYRNNVLHSLSEALAAQFPVVRRLVGAEFFAGLAREFICQQPPSTPALTFYGDGFAAFIQQHSHCKPAPYLADVARLEFSCQYALHATDSAPLAVTSLLALEPSALPDHGLRLHAGATLLQSRWPVQQIFSENQREEPGFVEVDSDCSSLLLIHRRNDQAEIVTLQAPAFLMLQRLQQGDSLQQAWEHLQTRFAVPDSELVPLLVYLLKLEIFTELLTPELLTTELLTGEPQ